MDIQRKKLIHRLIDGNQKKVKYLHEYISKFAGCGGISLLIIGVNVKNY